ncbi:MAG: porin family protein [Bacteroidota bacterium]
MKRFLSSFFLIFIISTTASAQNLDVGIKGGINSSSLTYLGNYDRKTGYQGGFFARFQTIFVGAQVEALYSHQGAKLNGEELQIDYVLFPILARLEFMNIINFQLGPQVGFLMDDNTSQQLNNQKVWGVMGVGVDLPFKLTLDFRYNFGITNTFQNKSGRSQFVSLSLGYLLF